MVPNHMFQLLAMTAMEPPNSFDADAVRSEKTKVLNSDQAAICRDPRPQSGPRQYVAGKIGGHDVPAYRAEPDVTRTATPEAYVEMRLRSTISAAGVPFYVGPASAWRSGARDRHQFQQAPYAHVPHTPVDALTPN